ncbi:MAG: hypothetical protein J6M05_00290 [Cardiobacteriaceae bacterium]|nr:hypothetical protein [Cardiobacteriaceae bacterium]
MYSKKLKIRALKIAKEHNAKFAAEELGISYHTVLRWIQNDKIKIKPLKKRNNTVKPKDLIADIINYPDDKTAQRSQRLNCTVREITYCQQVFKIIPKKLIDREYKKLEKIKNDIEIYPKDSIKNRARRLKFASTTIFQLFNKYDLRNYQQEVIKEQQKNGIELSVYDKNKLQETVKSIIQRKRKNKAKIVKRRHIPSKLK